MSGTGYVPERGDLVWLEFTPHAGREQAGRRPAVVVTPAEYNGVSGLMLCCPVTSRRRGLPFEVPLPPGGPVEGVVLSDHVKSVDWRARWAKRIGPAAPEVVREIRARLLALVE